MKTLTADPNNILPVIFPEDTTTGSDGDDWSAASLEQMAQQLLNRFELLKLQANPLGTVLAWAGPNSAVPTKYLLCDGQAISRATYAALFAQVGTAFGLGNGSSTFNVPDMRDKFVMGASVTNVLGNTGGSNDVTLSANQIPTHNHATTVDAAGSHTHTGSASNAGTHTHTADAIPGGGHTHSGATATDGTHSHYLRGDGSSGASGYWAPQLIQSASWNDYAGGPTGGTPPTHGTDPSNSVPTSAPGANKDAIPPQGSEHTHSLNITGVADHDHNITVDPVADHTHGITVNSAGSHTHTASSANIGGGLAHENRPAFVALAFIIRVL